MSECHDEVVVLPENAFNRLTSSEKAAALVAVAGGNRSWYLAHEPLSDWASLTSLHAFWVSLPITNKNLNIDSVNVWETNCFN